MPTRRRKDHYLTFTTEHRFLSITLQNKNLAIFHLLPAIWGKKERENRDVLLLMPTLHYLIKDYCLQKDSKKYCQSTTSNAHNPHPPPPQHHQNIKFYRADDPAMQLKVVLVVGVLEVHRKAHHSPEEFA